MYVFPLQYNVLFASFLYGDYPDWTVVEDLTIIEHTSDQKTRLDAWESSPYKGTLLKPGIIPQYKTKSLSRMVWTRVKDDLTPGGAMSCALVHESDCMPQRHTFSQICPCYVRVRTFLPSRQKSHKKSYFDDATLIIKFQSRATTTK